MEDLAVDELGADGILPGVMPRAEELLPEVEAPGRLALALAPLSCQLLALANGIHHVVAPTAQGPELRPDGHGVRALCTGTRGRLLSATHCGLQGTLGTLIQRSGLPVAASLLPLAPRGGRAGALNSLVGMRETDWTTG